MAPISNFFFGFIVITLLSKGIYSFYYFKFNDSLGLLGGDGLAPEGISTVLGLKCYSIIYMVGIG